MSDLAKQLLLSYQIFREYNLVKNLNLTHEIVRGALFPSTGKMSPYPIDL